MSWGEVMVTLCAGLLAVIVALSLLLLFFFSMDECRRRKANKK